MQKKQLMANFTVTRKTTIVEQLSIVADTKADAITAAKAASSTPAISVSASEITVTSIPSGVTVNTRQHWKAQQIG